MPPPTTGRSSPGPSAAPALLPYHPKAQELRAGLSSNSLRFLTQGRAKGLMALGPNGATRSPAGGGCCRHFEQYFYAEIPNCDT